MIVRSKAQITAKGQITLPLAIRKTLGVGRGDAVIFEVREGTVTVVPDAPEGRFKKFAGKFRVGRGSTKAETVKLVRDLRGRDE
jgi:AbrB family looped-hinge helix DNA binding protein